MSQTVHPDPETATTADMRAYMARERVNSNQLKPYLSISLSAFYTLINRPAAIDPDLNREVLAGVEKVKAERK